MSKTNIAIAVVLVAALAGAGLFAGGFVLDAEQNPLHDENGDDNAQSDAQNGDGEPDGSQNGESDTEESDADESEGKNSENGDAENDSDERSDEETEETETEALAGMPVELYVTDPAGPLEDGEGHLYNTSSEELKATYNFAEGHDNEFVIEELTPETTYDLVVNVSYYPEETITFSPRITDEVNETIGYEFQGADTYEMDWEVDDADVDVTYRGYSALDAEENYYSMWDSIGFDDSIDYLYLAMNNQTYLDSGVHGTDWEQSNAHWGDPSNSRDIVAMEGLSGLEDREFIEVHEPVVGDDLHVYDVPAFEGADPQRVHVDPDTGYAVYTDARIDEIDNPAATRAEAEIYSHNKEDFSAIPDDFPIEDIEDELED